MDCCKKKIFFTVLLCLVIFSYASASDFSPAKLYEIAKVKYHGLMSSSPKERIDRKSWYQAIELFQEAYQKEPKGPLADDSLFSAARLYRELFSREKNTDDLEKAIAYFQSVYEKFPDSALADDALFLTGESYYLHKKDYFQAYEAYKKIVISYPTGDRYEAAKTRLNEMLRFHAKKVTPVEQSSLNRVNDIRHWSNPKYSRIVIDLSNQADYKETLQRSPSRIYIDLFNTKLSPDMKKSPIKVMDGLLKEIRFGTHGENTTRVIIDIGNVNRYKIFALENPFRIVIDVKGGEISREKEIVGKEKRKPPAAKIEKEEKHPIVKEKRLTIVLDPGHGGKDSGAVGYNGLKEKTIVLDIAKRLQSFLKERTPHRVFLTRAKDVYISLEERTAIANTLNADLFISLHANASRRRGAIGVETYFLDYTFNEDVLETVARENNAPFLLKDDLQAILFDLKKTRDSNESVVLANNVQEAMISRLNANYRKIKDRGAKAGPFYVLFGAEMPSILVETFFISNKKEARMLESPVYRQKIAEAIFYGIQNYLAGQEKTGVRASN